MTVASLATITHSRPRHPADAGDDPRARRVAVVHAVRGQRRELEERRALVEQPVDALARQQLAARDVCRVAGLLAAAQPHPLELLAAGRRPAPRGRPRWLELAPCGLHLRHDLVARRPCPRRTTLQLGRPCRRSGAVERELHLHRLEHHDRLPGLDRVADRDSARAARVPGHRRPQLPVGVRVVRRPRPSPRRTCHAQPSWPSHAVAAGARPKAASRPRRASARATTSSGLAAVDRRASSTDGRAHAAEAPAVAARRTGRRSRGGRRASASAARRGRPPRRSAAARRGVQALDQAGVHLPRAHVVAARAARAGSRCWSSRPRIAVSASARSSRASAVARSRAVGDHLGDHRVVVGADHRAGLDRGVDAHAARVAAPAAPGRRTGGSCASSALTRASIAWPVQRRRRASSASPAATRSCSSTRSRPVTSSVTGCSTCSRAFISRKKCVDGIVGVGDELDRARAVVARGRAPARPPPRRARARSSGDDDRRRRLLEHLLVAALQRALALAEREHVAVRVADAPAPRCAARAAGSAR